MSRVIVSIFAFIQKMQVGTITLTIISHISITTNFLKHILILTEKA